MSSSSHIDNKEKIILVLGKGPTKELEHTLTAEKIYAINFTVTKKKFCLSLHYDGANSYSFLNGTEIIKFKAKNCEIAVSPLCLGNISKDLSVGKTRFTGYVYDFSADYDSTDIGDIKDIHKDKCRCECKELIDESVIKDLFRILVIVNANVINHVILVSI